MGDRLRLNVDGYYETRDAILVPVGSPVQYRSAGNIQYWGLDASVEANVTNVLTIFGNTSVVSDDLFVGEEFVGEELDAADPGGSVALNAPAFKVKGGFDYGLPRGVTIGASAHYVDDFPVRFGPYAGTVESYALLDVRLRSTIPAVPGLSVNVTAKNVLGNRHREFVGAPALGRMIIGRLTYELP